MPFVLYKFNLHNYVEIFNMEKITPDIVAKSSLSDFKELEIQSRSNIMVLRLECILIMDLRHLEESKMLGLTLILEEVRWPEIMAHCHIVVRMQKHRV